MFNHTKVTKTSQIRPSSICAVRKHPDTMNLKTSASKFLLTVLVAILVVSFNSLHTSQARINQLSQQQNREEENNAIVSQDDSNINNKFKVPFVVLMSSHEICVAQLPLIGYGNVSVVYRLNVDDHDWAESAQHETRKPSQQLADAREQQMPKSPSQSLGTNTFDRQQIAAAASREHQYEEEVGKRRRSEDVLQPARGAQESNLQSGEEEAAAAAVVEGITRALPREERSSSSIDTEAGGNSLHANNNSPNAGRSPVQESSSATPSATNVTSARFANEREEVVRGVRTEDADDDEFRNGAVQFSDFDVHMRLGFAFAADSKGRIHRFKLSGYGDSQPENDYTNSIGTGVGFDGPQTSAAAVAAATETQSDVIPVFLDGSRHNSSAHDDDDDANDGLVPDDSDNANKVGGLFSENSSRHPTTSGAERSGKVGSTGDGSLTSDSGAYETNYDKQRSSSFVINSARPRIIWSRTKHAHHQQTTSVDPASKRTMQADGVRGALSSARHNLSSKSNHQMGNDTEQLESDREIEEGQQHHTINVSGGNTESVDPTSESVASRQRSNGAREPRTEVAVDWLNNLLFVLDKHRLLALDYEGNNELVLIDDFNNQPVNLKADPINGFLFWLQVGKFHNTIYKLDLNVVLERYQNGTPNNDAPLTSRHYAHAIVTNLPTHAKLFIIDHKHSRIYVPLSSRCENSPDNNTTQRNDDAEVFSTPSDESNVVTHMNSTSTMSNDIALVDDKSPNVNESNSMLDGQILAYNLDGTDVGPLRSPKKSSHTYNFDDILDITLDTDKGLLYWLTNEGRDLFEEYQGGDDAPYHQAQHNLEGKKYKKLLHFNRGYNQPISKPRFNLRKLFQILAITTASNRLARSDRLNSMDEQGFASSLNGLRGSDSHLTRFSRSVVIVLGGVAIASLIGIFVYFISRPSLESANNTDHRDSGASSPGSFMGGSHVDSVAHTNGFMGASTISRWIPRPSTSSAGTSTFNRSSARNEPLDSCDIESSINYDRGNAVDEHYRDSVYDQTIVQIEQSCLSNLSKWPSNMCEMSNKLYVPIELQEDETLSSIPRVSIDQLHIEKRSPLGEGHFGTVLQGTIKCTLHERDLLLNKPSSRNIAVSMHLYVNDQESRDVTQCLNVPSSGSSGHGSSSVSSEFITANSVAEVSHGDYLLPKSSTNSATSDYSCGESHAPTVESYSNPNYLSNADLMKETKFKVAIKKLKENASPKERSDFLQEAKHLAKFDHPNIVSLVGICLDRGSTLIIMELMLGGDLIRYMQENKPTLDNMDRLSPDDLLSICLDIVNACCYLEEHEHIHRDLAARNCLVSSRKKEDRVVKLADFGLARDIYKDSYYKKLNDSAMPLKWMAPECFMEQKFTIKSDVWSFGVVMWEVMSYCQEKPYNNVEHFMMKDHLIEGLRLARPEHCCEDIYRLMHECWQLDPCRRPTFEECRATLIEIKGSVAAE